MPPSARLKLGIAGLGAIGYTVAKRIDAGEVEGVSLAAVSARDEAKARTRLAEFRSPPSVMPLVELATAADIVLECVPAAHFAEIARPAIAHGRIFMPLSVGQLLEHMDFVEAARTTGARIIVPTGALAGLDAVRAVAQGEVESIRIVTRKPPKGLAGAPFLVERALTITDLKEPLQVFEGSAREAIRGFPANVNVAVVLSLAGIGPDRTRVEIWADPGVVRNTHTILVVSKTSNLSITIENTPSLENPATGRITPLSVIASLRRLVDPLVVGT
jgi:aspartate dehydrogenase